MLIVKTHWENKNTEEIWNKDRKVKYKAYGSLPGSLIKLFDLIYLVLEKNDVDYLQK